jgi:predicted permease
MFFDRVRQDARYAVRGLARSPVFSITAILSIAIGVGGTAAIYSLANSLLLSDPPGVGNPDQVVNVGRTQDGSGFDNFSYLTFADYRARNSTFAGLAAVELSPRALSLRTPDGGVAVEASVVSGNLFSVLQARPALGRFFTPDEDRSPRTHAVAVLSHEFWQARFEGDSGVISRAIVLNGTPFTVVGVAAEGFHGSSFTNVSLWIPMMASPWLGTSESMLTTSRRGVWLTAVGRLKPDVGIGQAQVDLVTIHAQLAQEYPEVYEGQGVRVLPLSLFPGDLRRMVGLFTTFLFALTGLVLVIGGTNVAGMLLARSAARRREIAVRLAIGASRRRLVRQLITESAVLFAVAGAAGALLSGLVIRALMSLVPALPFRVAIAPAIDWRVVLFALAVAVVAGILAGLAPALQSTRPDLAPELRSDAGGGGQRRQRLRSSLLVMQITFSTLLLVVAGLFGRALMRAGTIDPGFDPRGIHVATLDLGLVNHTAETGRQFVDRLLAGAGALPGVQSVAMSRVIPLEGTSMGLGGVVVDGRPAPGPDASWNADWNIVSPAYFDVMRIPVVRGRAFTDADRAGAPDVAIINEHLASRIWPGEDAIGKSFRNDERTVTVIGVARNAKQRSLGESPRGFVYVPLGQRYSGTLSLFVRTTPGAPMAIPVRRLVAELDASLPILTSQTMETHTAIGLFPQRVAAWVAGSMGVVALLLALIGIYGVTAYGVAQRTREIGIRIALGSSPRTVQGSVIGQGLRLSLSGVALGIVAAVLATRVLESLLFGVSGADPLAVGAAGLLLLSAAVIASWVPARRAAGVDPMVALRQE